MELPLNTIINGDCLEFMKTLPDCSLDLTVTSPPYDNLRKYKGFYFDFESIAKELFRITKSGGVVVWIVGDETKNFCESMTSFRQALYFNNVGFNLLDTMIYFKKGVPPLYPDAKRYTPKFEYMFVLTKGKPKTFNPLKDKPNKCAGITPSIGMRQKDGSIRKKTIRVKKIKDFGLRDNVWEYQNGGKKFGDHPAVFPLELARDHIKSWSNKNDLVFDPFLGSGTTAVACKQLGRTYIGCEISKEYCDIAQKRLDNLTQSLF